MWPYFFLFFINIFCAIGLEKTIRDNRVMSFIYMTIIILSNTIIIGLRDFGVGIDTTIYVDQYFNYAKNLNSLKMFIDNWYDFDRGYVVLAYLSSIFSNNSQSLLVFTEFFITLFIMLGLYEFKKKYPQISIPWFFVLFWILYQYHTENLMRQYCAIALLFYGYSHFIQGRYKLFLILQLLAFTFHSSSILFLMVPGFHYFSTIKSRKIRTLYTVCVFVGILVLLFAYYYIMNSLQNYGLLKDIYIDRYGIGSEYEIEGDAQFGFRYMCKYVIPLVMIYYSKQKKIVSNEVFYILFTLFISNMLLEQMRFVMVFFFRLAHYIGFVMIVYFSIIIRKHDMISLIMLVSYLILISISSYTNYFTTNENGWSYYYSSRILGI